MLVDGEVEDKVDGEARCRLRAGADAATWRFRRDGNAAGGHRAWSRSGSRMQTAGRVAMIAEKCELESGSPAAGGLAAESTSTRSLPEQCRSSKIARHRWTTPRRHTRIQCHSLSSQGALIAPAAFLFARLRTHLPYPSFAPSDLSPNVNRVCHRTSLKRTVSI